MGFSWPFRGVRLLLCCTASLDLARDSSDQPDTSGYNFAWVSRETARPSSPAGAMRNPLTWTNNKRQGEGAGEVPFFGP